MKKITVLLFSVVIIFALYGCSGAEKTAPLPQDALSYDEVSSNAEVTYVNGDAIVILEKDNEGKLNWNYTIADESKLEATEEYLVVSDDSAVDKAYMVWVFSGLDEGSEIQVNFFKTDKSGNTGYSGERIFAFNVSADLEVSMQWGRLVVKSDNATG